MAVYRLFKNKPFGPEAIATMSRAHSEVCRTLGVAERDHPQATAVAKKIIEFAQRGERDPIRLREFVLQALQYEMHALTGQGADSHGCAARHAGP